MSRSFLVLLLAGLALPAMGQSPQEKEQERRPNAAVLTIKTGAMRLVDHSQRIDGVDSVFEKYARVFSFEGEGSLHRVIENVALGGEALYYRNDFRRGNNLHTLYTAAYLLKVKYYFRPGKDWRPYLGAGVGTAISNDLYGPLHRHAEGTAYQGVVGMQWRVTDRIGGRLEYMHLSARETHPSGEINASARALFVGLSVFFGRR